MIADNQLSLLASGNDTLLRVELQELSPVAFDLSVLCFAKADLAEPVGEDKPKVLLELPNITIVDSGGASPEVGPRGGSGGGSS